MAFRRGKGYTKSGRRKSASYQQIAPWVDECWRSIDKDLITQSFVGCGITDYERHKVPLNSCLCQLLEKGAISEGGETSSTGDEDDDDGSSNDSLGDDSHGESSTGDDQAKSDD